MRGDTKAFLSREAGSGAAGHVAASEPSRAERGGGSGAVRHVVPPEPSRTGRPGPDTVGHAATRGHTPYFLP
jgi:hypothetical protein